MMFYNYLKIGWRSLIKNRLFSIINIFGLALSLAICMIVMIRMKDAFSYDRFHPYPDRTYRVISEINNKRGDRWKLASTPLPLKENLLHNNDIIETIVNIYPAILQKAYNETKELKIRGAFTSPSFFEVFGMALSHGNSTTALQKPNSIVLSNEISERFFGKKEALGQVLTLGELGVFEITGILKTSPGNSHLDFDAYVSAASIPRLEKANKLPKMLESWDSFEQSYTYVLLKSNSSLYAFQNILNEISIQVNKLSKDGQFNFIPEPLGAITPGSNDVFNGIGKGTSWMKVYIEGAVGLILLLVACFNYTSLTIARALTRAKEVGIRKTSGASRGQVFAQYIIEAAMIALFALSIAYVILLYILRYKPFNDEYEMVPDMGIDLSLFIVFLLFTSITGIIAGALPAWVLSAFKPATVLKNVSTQKLLGSLSLRRVLIVFQFSFSLLTIIFLSVFYRQFAFIEGAEYGFRKENILAIPLNKTKQEILTNELLSLNGVNMVSSVSDHFGGRPSGEVSVLYDKDQSQHISLAYYFTDQNAVPVMGLKLIAGENLQATNSNSKGKELIINETAVAAMGFKSNLEAIGKSIWLQDTAEARITGVVKDFFYRNPGIHIRPMALINNPAEANFLLIYTSGKNKDILVHQIQAVWKSHENNFTYQWLDNYLEENNNQKATISLLGYLAFTAIAIASLGLLGLVVYTVETRRKEISIRKVMGASMKNVIILLSHGFIKLLLISGLIAMPIGYFLAKMFLQNFPSRIELGFASMVLCFGALLVIGLITIFSQTWKAAAESPIKNLRSE